MLKNKKGFTMIELLVVLTVIAVLSGFIVSSFWGMHTEAKKAKTQGDLRILKLAIEAYNAKNSAYPAALETLRGGSVVQEIPKDPFSATDSEYRYVFNGNYYAAWSVGPDNQTTDCTITTDGVVTVGGGTQIGATNGTPPNPEWK